MYLQVSQVSPCQPGKQEQLPSPSIPPLQYPLGEQSQTINNNLLQVIDCSAI